MQEIGILLTKDIRLEWRNKYAISGILLYVLSTVFIVYISFKEVHRQTWNTLFWMLILFASVNAVSKSFMQENSSRQLYYYSLTNPLAIILSKIIYNVGLLLVISLLSWLAFGFVAGNPVKAANEFFIALFLGSVGFSITFTFISAISIKADNSATLMAILSFPVIIPILLTLLDLSVGALRLPQGSSIDNGMVILIAIDFLLLGLAIILYPFLWKD